MKRAKGMRKSDIIHIAKSLEFGDTFYKVDSGSIAHALIEARYYLEHGMSSKDYRDKRYMIADEFMRQL